MVHDFAAECAYKERPQLSPGERDSMPAPETTARGMDLCPSDVIPNPYVCTAQDGHILLRNKGRKPVMQIFDRITLMSAVCLASLLLLAGPVNAGGL